MSQETTVLGPQVSLGTNLSHGGQSTGTFEVPSWVTVDVDGHLDAADANFFSRQTSASLDSTTLQDGELAISVEPTSLATIYFRSGATTYQFVSDTSTVL